MFGQVQEYINKGLIVMDDQGKPIMNAEAVIQSEMQSMASEPRQQEPDMIVPNRRQARAFGANQLEEIQSNF